MDTTVLRTGWIVFDVAVTTGDGAWHYRETDPAEALAKARAQMLTPALPDPFSQEGALAHLVTGAALSGRCADGAHITITPILL